MHSDPADARPAPPRQEIYTKKPAASRLPVIALIAVGAVFAFGTSIWYAYQYGVNQQVAANPPLIKAEPGPTKLKPDDPGGMEVPDRDKLVYDRVTDSPPEPRTERLLPPPDEPMAKPDAPPPPPAAEQATDEPKTDTAKAVADAAPPPPAPAAEPATEAASEPASAQKELSTQTVDKLVAVAPAAAPPPPPAAESKPAAQAEPEKPAAAEPPKQVAVAPPPKPQPAAKTPTKPKAAAAGSYRVQLASFRSSKAANDAWSKLRKSNISLLRDLTAHVTRVELGQKGTFYRLQAGSFAQEARARSICTELKARQVDCLVVRTN